MIVDVMRVSIADAISTPAPVRRLGAKEVSGLMVKDPLLLGKR